MTSYPIIENVTLSYSNITNEIYPLIKSIRSDWTSSNTRLVTFTEGLTNIILGIFDNRTPDDDSNALIIKIYGIQTELFIDRQAEINAMIKFHEHGVFSQRVLIQFNNGIIYEFASDKNSFDLSSILSDIDIIEERILPRLVQNPKHGKDLVLCHNDLLVKNIVYNDKNQTISFIDFEYTHLNYALFDIANHFVEYAGVENADFSIYPSYDEQKKWLKIYFQTRQLDQQIIDDDLCRLIEKF
ncbi:unnamed protein product, partial [Adineta steineri]